MYVIFISGSCRLLRAFGSDYNNKVYALNSLDTKFIGNNFMGKLHDIDQHIQFIKYLTNKITIPKKILSLFLTTYWKDINLSENDSHRNSDKLKEIQNKFNIANIYIFEICSLKTYYKEGFFVQEELCRPSPESVNLFIKNKSEGNNIFEKYDTKILSSEELYLKLNILRNLIHSSKPIVFQTHLRPNIMYNNDNMSIKNREIIFNTIENFCKNNINVFIYDPSIIVKLYGSTMLKDNNHFSEEGHIKNFEYIYKNYICK
tara:strand:+ start:1083 stop:1862 length:780 start_codon:yes stop_codon:yes gene_type:complete